MYTDTCTEREGERERPMKSLLQIDHPGVGPSEMGRRLPSPTANMQTICDVFVRRARHAQLHPPHNTPLRLLFRTLRSELCHHRGGEKE